MSTSLPLSSIVGVSVVVSPVASPGPSFNQALIVGPSTVIPSVGANSRVQLYQSLLAMQQAEFSITSPEYLAAELYFGQRPQPTFLWIGRQDLTAIETAIVGASGGTGYTVGDILTVVQSGASAGQFKVTTIGGGGVVTGISRVAGGTGYSVATNLATTGGTGTGAEINVSTIGESAVEAVSACRLAQPDWYACMFVGTAVDADHLAIAAFIEAASPASVYFLTSGSSAVLNGTANNLFAELQTANYRRTFSVYSTTQGGTFPNNAYASAAPMGMAMGRNNGAAGSYFDLMFKLISGVAAEPLTQTQVNSICGTIDRSSNGLNGNVVLEYAGNRIWLQPGTTASGAWFDEVLNLDMLAADIQNSAINLLTSVPALPITNAGVATMQAVISDACVRAQQIGFIASSGQWGGVQIGTGRAAIASGDALPNGYALYSPPVSTLSSGQRSARLLPPITVAVIEAQSGHSLSVNVNVQQ
ncbi:MAG TPA: DUF3383 family protein [Candidatus Limnocylindrales bacterium]|nr:DUF3383 family protein [Candidatus Limnocylindrales bacterium]